IFLPNLLWNIQHHWPFLELMHNIRVSGKDIAYPFVPYFTQQVVMMNPFALPFCLPGLLFLLFSRALAPYRFFAWGFLIVIAFFFVSHGKDYYSAPAYSIVLAAGAVAVENLLATPSIEPRTRWRVALKPVCFVWLVIGIALVLPLVIPVLPLNA